MQHISALVSFTAASTKTSSQPGKVLMSGTLNLAPLPSFKVDRAVSQALAEDLGRAGDGVSVYRYGFGSEVDRRR